MLLLPHNQIVYEYAVKMLMEHGKCAIVQATGTGKSFIEMALLGSIFKGLRVIILVPTHAVADGIKIYKEWVYDAEFILYSSAKNIHDNFDVLILDELHRAGAPTWEPEVKRLMMKAKYVVGLTATQYRHLDGNRDMASELFGDCVVYGVSRAEAIQQGIHQPFKYVAILSDVKDYILQFDRSEIPEGLRTRIRNLRLDEYQLSERIRAHTSGHNKVCIFYPDYDTMCQADMDIRSWFSDDVSIFMVTSRQSNSANLKNIIEFNSCESIAIIKSVDMLNEGIHIDGVTLCIFARKTYSKNVFSQQMGRAASTNKSEVQPTYIDLVNNFTNVKDTLKSMSVSSGSGDKSDCVDLTRMLVSYDEVLVELEDIVNTVNRKWTATEDLIIHAFYPIEGSGCYVRFDNRTEADVVKRAKVLGITKNKRWSEDEDNILREFYHLEENMIWKRLPGRSNASIRARAKKLGLIPTWEKWEDKIMLDYFIYGGVKAVAEKLSDKSDSDIRKRARYLGLGVYKNEGGLNIIK